MPKPSQSYFPNFISQTSNMLRPSDIPVNLLLYLLLCLLSLPQHLCLKTWQHRRFLHLFFIFFPCCSLITHQTWDFSPDVPIHFVTSHPDSLWPWTDGMNGVCMVYIAHRKSFPFPELSPVALMLSTRRILYDPNKGADRGFCFINRKDLKVPNMPTSEWQF